MAITTWKQLVYDYIAAYKYVIKDDTPIAAGTVADAIKNLKLISFNSSTDIIGSAYLRSDITYTPIDIYETKNGEISPDFPYIIPAGTLITENYTINGNSGESIDDLKVQHKDVVPGINPVTVLPDDGYHYLTSVKVTAIPEGTLAIKSETNDNKTIITAYPSTVGYVDSTDAVTLEIAAEAPTMADVEFITNETNLQHTIGLQINKEGQINNSNKPEDLIFNLKKTSETLSPSKTDITKKGFGYYNHRVSADTDELTITPTTETQVFEATDAFYTKVTVNPVNADEDLTALLNAQDQKIQQIESQLADTIISNKQLQEKTVTPDTETIEVIPDNGYYLSKVIVEGIDPADSIWEDFSITYNFPDGGIFNNRSTDGVLNTGTLFTLDKDRWVTNITCTGYYSSDSGTKCNFDPMTIYEYVSYTGERSTTIGTNLLLILNKKVQSSKLGNLSINSVYNKSVHENFLEWVIDGNNVSLTRNGALRSYDETSWSIKSITIKGIVAK